MPVPVFLSRSSKVLYTEDFKSLDIGSWQDDLQKSTQSPLSLEQLGDYLSKAPGPAVLVDNTSSEDVAEAYPALLARGVHVVTPNKKGFSGSYDLWRQIFAGAERPGRGLVYHESTVGAGLPIISTLNELVETGDEVQKIEGVFSGTMSFLFNSFAPVGGGGGRFSEEVKKAKDLGFTVRRTEIPNHSRAQLFADNECQFQEPDPRDDLNGLDVARKLTILARISGLAVESPTSFPVESLIPRPLESAETGDEFLARLPEHDDGMDALKKETEAEGKVIRYVGSINIATKEVKVSLEKCAHPVSSGKYSPQSLAVKRLLCLWR